MAYSQTVNLLSPADDAVLPILESLNVSKSGDLLPIQWYINGVSVYSTPIESLWVTRTPYLTFSMASSGSWYVRYTSACDTKTFNSTTDSWEFTNETIVQTSSRNYSVAYAVKSTPVDGTDVSAITNVSLKWVDTGTGATKWRWTILYNHPTFGPSSLSGSVNAPVTSVDISSQIANLKTLGVVSGDWYIRTYVNSYITDIEGNWGIIISGAPTTTAPGQATTPFPTNAGVSISLNISALTWVDGGNTDYFKVYVGDTSGSLTWIASTITSLPLVDYLATISYPFDYKETLYWRVDAVNSDATTSGVEWSFTTLKLTPPSPTGYYTTTKQFYRLLPVTSTTSGWGSAPGIGVENYDFAFLTSDYFYNVINTNKKLIAAANSAIWYET